MEDQDQLQEIFIPYTYTFDQFTVFFYGDRVFVGEKSFPIGQCTIDVMNLSAGLWDEIDRRVQQFLPAAQQLLNKKADSVVASVQEKLNAVWDVIFTLPVYRDLRIDEECSYHALENLLTEGTNGHRSSCQVQRDTPCIWNFWKGWLTLLTASADSRARSLL